jgi:(4S)-4-hydroxy-5-phosphonooxypentane-2,3-dione isomerase
MGLCRSCLKIRLLARSAGDTLDSMALGELPAATDKACNLVPGVQPCTMVALLVHIQVKPDCIEQFLAETIENARNSRKEPGIVRFDLIQEVEDPSRFVLFELYRDQPAAEAHRLTAHYAKWRDAVPSLLVTERTRKIYRPIEPAV